MTRLGDNLLDEEKIFLANNLTDSLKEFNKVTSENGKLKKFNSFISTNDHHHFPLHSL